MTPHWRIRLARWAEHDIADILAWTAREFGPAQADSYAQTLTLALQALLKGPGATGIRPRDDILPGVHVLHVARQRRRGRHFVVFRFTEPHDVDVLRVLHDSMDLARQVSAGSEPPAC